MKSTGRTVSALCIGSLLLFVGCGDSGGSDPGPLVPMNAAPTGPEDPNPSTASAVEVTAENVDLAVETLDELVEQLMTDTGVPGVAVSVVQGGEVLFEKGYGVRKVGETEKVDEDTVFQIASVSKPVGSTAVAGVVGEGKVSWDDRITEYIPDFKLSDPNSTAEVTIADMYSHRSGLPGHAGDLLEDIGYDREQVLQRLRYLPVTPIRSDYAYTNFGMTAGAEAVSVATGIPWEELVRQQVYEPLGMDSSSSSFADFRAAGNRAWTHVRVGDQWQAKSVRQPDAQSPAGGVSSTVSDMAKWMELQLGNGTFDGKEVIDPEALLAIHTPQVVSVPPGTADSRSGFYGLGFNVSNDAAGRVRLGHSGAFALGAATSVALLPSAELGITVLTNGWPIGVPEAISATFMDIAEFGQTRFEWYPLVRELFVPLLENESRIADRQPPADASPPGPPNDYTGVYENRYYGDLDVESREGGLVALLGPDRRPIPLKPWNGNRFSWTPPGENSVGQSLVTFKPSVGRAETVTFEFLDKQGLGTFTR
jgi:CubicO group peptidase (beta-lactamase class C family)